MTQSAYSFVSPLHGYVPIVWSDFLVWKGQGAEQSQQLVEFHESNFPFADVSFLQAFRLFIGSAQNCLERFLVWKEQGGRTVASNSCEF